MNLKTLNVTNINAPVLCLGAILVLPILPSLGFVNIANVFLALALMSLLFFYDRKKQWSFNLMDLGFLLIGITVLLTFIRDAWGVGAIPVGKTHFVLFAMVLTYFSLRQIGGRQASNRRLFSKLLLVTFFGIALFILYQAVRYDFNYAMLTSAFSYQKGLGNISQLSMYLSFYLISVFYLEKKLLPLVILSMTSLALVFVLQSKLLLLVLACLWFGKFLSKYDLKTNVINISILGAAAFAILCLVPPASLQGRIDLFIISWLNYDYGMVLGYGLGNFNSFINQVLEGGQVVNTVGHIDHLAFNDFTQFLVELGYPGLLGLGLVFIGGVRKENLFFIVALFLIVFIMFPLQYLESAILFAFVSYLLRPKNHWVIPKFKSSSIVLQPVLLGLACGLFFYVLYEASIYKKWSAVDDRISKNEMETFDFEIYKRLESQLCGLDDYYLRYGVHAFSKQKYNSAMVAFKKAQVLNPSYESYIHLGDCYFEMGFYDVAIPLYEKALLIRPKHLYPVYKSIYCFNNLNKKDKAKEYWGKLKGNYKKLYSPKMMTMNKEIETLLAQR